MSGNVRNCHSPTSDWGHRMLPLSRRSPTGVHQPVEDSSLTSGKVRKLPTTGCRSGCPVRRRRADQARRNPSQTPDATIAALRFDLVTRVLSSLRQNPSRPTTPKSPTKTANGTWYIIHAPYNFGHRIQPNLAPHTWSAANFCVSCETWRPSSLIDTEKQGFTSLSSKLSHPSHPPRWG